MTASNPYEANFRRLVAVLGPVETWPKPGDACKYAAPGFMDLHFDVLERDRAAGFYRIVLHHAYKQNGDMVPDPDMELCVQVPVAGAPGAPGTVEAMTFQDARVYQEVYPNHSYPAPGKGNPALRRSLNAFLTMWLENLKAQGHARVADPEEASS